MTQTLNDQEMIHRLQTELEGATYGRAPGTFAARSRTPRLAGVMAAVAAVAATAVMAWPGSSSPALAWSPTPTPATSADEMAASAACSSDLENLDLGALVALDLRGTGGLATFSDGNITYTCLLVRDGDGFERGPLIGEERSNTPDTGLAFLGAASTEWKDGTMIAMLTGSAPAGASTVEISIPGQSSATAVVTNGRFAIWWFGTVENLSGSVTALDANGVELDQSDLGTLKGDDSGR